MSHEAKWSGLCGQTVTMVASTDSGTSQWPNISGCHGNVDGSHMGLTNEASLSGQSSASPACKPPPVASAKWAWKVPFYLGFHGNLLY